MNEGRKKAFAQLYVHNPAAVDDIAVQRRDYMHLPKGTSKRNRAKALELLKTLEAELSTVFPNVQPARMRGLATRLGSTFC